MKDNRFNFFAARTCKPGEFSARCNLRRWKPDKKLTVEERHEATEKGYDRRFVELDSERVDQEKRRHGRWEWGFPACAGFETEDAALFDAHMADRHGKKLTRHRDRKPGQGMWRGPRLTEAGTAFEPEPWEAGTEVTWEQRVPTGQAYTDHEQGGRRRDVLDKRTRTGQVWCLGYGGAWVVPDEPCTDFEGRVEQALLLEPPKRPGEFVGVRQTTFRTARAEVAA